MLGGLERRLLLLVRAFGRGSRLRQSRLDGVLAGQGTLERPAHLLHRVEPASVVRLRRLACRSRPFEPFEPSPDGIALPNSHDALRGMSFIPVASVATKPGRSRAFAIALSLTLARASQREVTCPGRHAAECAGTGERCSRRDQRAWWWTRSPIRSCGSVARPQKSRPNPLRLVTKRQKPTRQQRTRVRYQYACSAAVRRGRLGDLGRLRASADSSRSAWEDHHD